MYSWNRKVIRTSDIILCELSYILSIDFIYSSYHLLVFLPTITLRYPHLVNFHSPTISSFNSYEIVQYTTDYIVLCFQAIQAIALSFYTKIQNYDNYYSLFLFLQIKVIYIKFFLVICCSLW